MRPFTLVAFSVAAFILSGCSHTAQPIKPVSSAPVPLILKGHTEVSIVQYQCDQGIGQIEIRYFPHHGVAVLVLEGATYELQQQRTASGIMYTNDHYKVRSKANEAVLEIGRRMPIHCQAE